LTLASSQSSSHGKPATSASTVVARAPFPQIDELKQIMLKIRLALRPAWHFHYYFFRVENKKR
jgi:hypothetical protein